MDLLPRLPVLGARCFVRRSVLGLDEAEACSRGSMTGEACRSMVPAKCSPFIAVNSLTPRGKAGFEYAVPG